jgi:alkylhydroperoxidase family enzyme
MRVPYVTDSASKTDTERTIFERIKERRQPGPLLDLDRALLHSPEVADGWNSFFGSIRERTSLSADIRELAICRIAILNKAQFEWCQHAPLAKEAGVDENGLRDEQTKAKG